MGAYEITIQYTDQATVPEKSDRPPESRFSTPWIMCNRGLFRVNVSVIGPQSKQSERHFTLARSHAERAGQAIADLVESLEEQIRS